MIIQNSAVNIMFPRVENIKKHYILNEEILKDKFNEANILPIPDDAPMEIPRILISSKSEHSQLNIAPGAVNFQTIYANEYPESWELCEKYISSRVEDVFELTDKFALGKYKYMGIVTNLIWDDIQENGNMILFRNLFGREVVGNLDDLEVKYTYVENEKYYVNITLQSARLYKEVETEEAGNFTDDKLQAHTISITLDVNDRYSFNEKKEYSSSKETFGELLSLTTSIINDKLKKLVEKGEY